MGETLRSAVIKYPPPTVVLHYNIAQMQHDESYPFSGFNIVADQCICELQMVSRTTAHSLNPGETASLSIEDFPSVRRRE